MRSRAKLVESQSLYRHTAGLIYRFAGTGDDGASPDDFLGAQRQSRPDELPYTVEVWDETRSVAEQVVAVTAHASIGHAAFYAATRDYPERYITLRLRERIIARWNAPER